MLGYTGTGMYLECFGWALSSYIPVGTGIIVVFRMLQEMLASSRIGADEDINDYAGKTEEEINELIAAKVSKH
jgi:hypothetical protein